GNRAGGLGIRPMIDSAETDLPEPDSPTMPSVSPGRIDQLTPSTALTTPASVSKWTRRSSISINGSPAAAAVGLLPSSVIGASERPSSEFRIERVADPVAHEHETEDGVHDGHGREEPHEVLVPEEALAGGDHVAPVGGVGVRARAQVGEGYLGDDRHTDAHCAVHDHRRQAVGEHVPG